MLRKIVVSRTFLFFMIAFSLFMIAIGVALVAERNVKDNKFTLPVPELEKFLLTNSEMPEYRLEYQHKRRWFIGMQEDKIQEKIGVEQRWVSSSGIKIGVDYCVFNSHQEALEAATFHISNVASVFKEGSFTGLPVGDKSWISTQSHGGAIMVVRGNKLVLVGDPLYREGEGKRLEDIMRIIIAKAVK